MAVKCEKWNYCNDWITSPKNLSNNLDFFYKPDPRRVLSPVKEKKIIDLMRPNSKVLSNLGYDKSRYFTNQGSKTANDTPIK